jgi:hypothetical protein
VEELQIDWLSSEDLKEEKVVSAPNTNYKPSRLVVPKFRANNHAMFELSWLYITNPMRLVTDSLFSKWSSLGTKMKGRSVEASA